MQVLQLRSELKGVQHEYTKMLVELKLMDNLEEKKIKEYYC